MVLQANSTKCSKCRVSLFNFEFNKLFLMVRKEGISNSFYKRSITFLSKAKKDM